MPKYRPDWLEFTEAVKLTAKRWRLGINEETANQLFQACRDGRVRSRFPEMPLDQTIPLALWGHLDPNVNPGGATERILSVLVNRRDLEAWWHDVEEESTGESLAARKPASERRIYAAITKAYDEAEDAGSKPPNVKEIVAPVKAILNKAGYEASGNQIQKLAGDPQHAARRGKVGVRRKTLTSEKRQQSR
jgi:hypothetical protein